VIEIKKETGGLNRNDECVQMAYLLWGVCVFSRHCKQLPFWVLVGDKCN